MPTPKTVRIELGPRSYDVRVGAGVLDSLGAAAAALDNVSQVVIITDATVARLYGQRATDALAGARLPASLLDFAPGEPSKTHKTWRMLHDAIFALAPPIDRDSLVVALGGGVVGDVAGFVAATSLRGLRWLQCPTTLLADVDASVGGKTGIDHPAGKNLIGAFHQPVGVLIDVETLRTLSDEDVRNGLAECLKHAVIREPSLLEFIETNVASILASDPEITTDLVARNVAIKAAVVADDETESGSRAHLNFGHTIGHALETLAGYDKLAHGRAVSLGMVAANHIAVARGLLDAGAAERIEAALAALGLPVRRGRLDARRIWQTMQHDKKARGGKVRMVLASGLGRVDVYDDITAAAVRDAVAALAE